MIYNRQGTFLTPEEFKPIQKSFELKNLKKIQAMNMNMRGWQKFPDYIKHHRMGINGMIKVPAGIRSVWNDRFTNNYGEVNIINHSSLLNPFGDEEDVSLSTKQNIAINSLLQQDVGLLWASTGTGKTNCIAKIIDKLKCKTLIVCCNLELMNQMKDDLEMFFGVKCRTISGIKTKQKGCYEDIVIGNIDSLIKLPEEYLKQFDLVLYDEVDRYLQADKRIDFIFNCSMKYQYGLTGTIKLNHIEDKIFDIYFGKKTELLLKHFQPNIYKVLTNFEYILDDIKDFHELKAALYENEERNQLIVDTITKTINGRKGVVFCEYVEHSRLICNMLEKRGIKTFMLIGEVKKDDRARIKKELKEYKGPCCLVGSVKIVGRGFNLPELSAGYLTTCEKFQSNIFQYIGRIIRQYKGKTQADWYDFIDPGCRILANQAKARHTQYKKEFPTSNIEFY